MSTGVLKKAPFLAYLLVLWTTFTGALTAGLGQGFDLGTEWPGALYRLLAAVAAGSFEPIHRFSTVLAGAAVVIAFLKNRKSIYGAAALAALVATALTGRVVLLALGGEVPKPLAYLVYPINNLAAFATAFFLLMLAVPEMPQWRRRILLRGAAFWSVVASLTGAYILGVHKIDRSPFMYSLSLDPGSAPLLLHIAAGGLAAALTAAASVGGRGLWRPVLAGASLLQAATGLAMYLGATANTWAPGPQTALHAVLAHLMATTTLVAYLKSRG
ncbi:respiratory chain protein [Pyrobaculum ferrireducens]|nr:respiratory chain protein [Pyrobaculum ferrireducens]